MYSNRTPDSYPENDSNNNQTEQIAEPHPAPARRNPRLVIGNLDYFDLLMEQDEL